jgi:hypothetical protein
VKAIKDYAQRRARQDRRKRRPTRCGKLDISTHQGLIRHGVPHEDEFDFQTLLLVVTLLLGDLESDQHGLPRESYPDRPRFPFGDRDKDQQNANQNIQCEIPPYRNCPPPGIVEAHAPHERDTREKSLPSTLPSPSDSKVFLLQPGSHVHPCSQIAFNLFDTIRIAIGKP